MQISIFGGLFLKRVLCAIFGWMNKKVSAQVVIAVLHDRFEVRGPGRIEGV